MNRFLPDAGWEERDHPRTAGGQFAGKSNDEWRKEIKEHLKGVKGADLHNEVTGIDARLSSEGINKMTSGAAIKKIH